MSRFILVFDIDGVVRDVSGSYRRAIADAVEHFTAGAFRPNSVDIDSLKSEGVWNNDWEASLELVCRYFERIGRSRNQLDFKYDELIAFFQSRYRGNDDKNWTGYICDEPLLLSPAYLETLTIGGVAWGFFSGAMRDEAAYVLSGKLSLNSPVLVAMEDAPGKPDPTGLFAAIEQLENLHGLESNLPVIYAGDTVADIYTVVKARELQPNRLWLGAGILPPHVLDDSARCESYALALKTAGAAAVFRNVEELNTARIGELVK
ncbi:MAG: TIGR01548 family HAD-type hydrolase [Microcoleus sp. PH2017_10_PVI_O_A]|uniref:TIGR01548 family HAD-type hydrolase n=1 Tax=unclassified Microcoleus TaxID=2642155 RepID=UPI001D7853FD|nr:MULTISPECIES: TIGR01548 family HAD-type hydrolase [unclassified Microcoleus]TAE82442.1 MAG: TIGR01548 family HAD-type hydrolase [Oscillatoriales cyanobacterium]MCC3406202.1 TIGR01548 family HAD-type hydrolase [Microcoleus sp. PH2017_10_PVI_O_A]MCC3460793.1 TIGR01548 family HAD-type hydrolase [Microcoleus sp. PH2017_11_PCY_U_A]MCC3479356.1 TIGR01548 family HAD-type hydrolase [Microcoleus sp. PH2017_12_PCY_D_A]MCC3529145.1 TIGR01548 family HAD-type hydrolase [Microcoleus sp. PH2017_21_RUC_O_A